MSGAWFRIRIDAVLMFAALCAPAQTAAQSNVSSAALACRWANVIAPRDQPLQQCPAASDERRELARSLELLLEYEQGRDRGDALRALSIARRAAAERPDDGWAEFVVGAVLARGPDVRARLGDDPRVYVVKERTNAGLEAPRALRRALELSPDLHGAAHVFAELALDFGYADLLNEALALLVADGRHVDPHSMVLRAEILGRLGRIADAAAIADSVRLQGGDPAIAAHTRAAALLRDPRHVEAGAAEYFQGVSRLTPAASDVYFDALGPILRERSLTAWQALHGIDERRQWLRDFWEMESALSGVPVSERLAAHYTRLALVLRDGRVACMGADVPKPMGPRVAPSPEEVELIGGSANQLAWASFAPAGCRERLNGSKKDLRGLGVASTTELMVLRHGDPMRVRRVYACGAAVLDLPLPLQPSAADCALTPVGRMRGRQLAESRLGQFQSEDRAVPGSSFYPPFDSHLQVVWEMLQFRGADGRTDLVAALAVPAASARQLTNLRGQLDAELMITLVDTAALRTARVRLRRSFEVGRLPDDGWVLMNGTLAGEAGRNQVYRVSITDPQRRKGRIVGGVLDLRAHSQTALDMSDVVIAPTDGTPSFTRGNVRVSLAPGREYERDEELILYYELYGLPERAPYRTEVEIRPRRTIGSALRALFPGAREAQQLAFSETAEQVDARYGVQVQRTIGLEGLLPGDYRITIRVTQLDTGATVSREAALVVKQ